VGPYFLLHSFFIRIKDEKEDFYSLIDCFGRTDHKGHTKVCPTYSSEWPRNDAKTLSVSRNDGVSGNSGDTLLNCFKNDRPEGAPM